MKLLTHNMLTSHVRGVRAGGGFPLRIQATEVKVKNVDFNPEFIARMIPKLEWGALVEAAESSPFKAIQIVASTTSCGSEFQSLYLPVLAGSASLVQRSACTVAKQMLRGPCKQDLGQRSDLPSELIPDYKDDENFLRKVHHVLMEVEVVEGVLKCPDTGREFPITKGIPNMLLSEEET
ncbi:Multifunctional methyltransferase subunit TRM112-like protein [Varanus komodoensis]|nr:Multifunctional methyltransferase subunit TRM112-like protein [Varanus komodoensis]